jgi:hypothetical protein
LLGTAEIDIARANAVEFGDAEPGTDNRDACHDEQRFE